MTKKKEFKKNIRKYIDHGGLKNLAGVMSYLLSVEIEMYKIIRKKQPW